VDDGECEGSFGMAQLLSGRWRWLGRPAFLACVVVLAVNDHVLKQRFPGWWTGKMSDVAGVAVLGTLLAVVLGARRGLVATGIGFMLLKAVPGVAEAAAPVLGGVTARDLGDLLALGVLVPLALMLSSSGGVTTASPARPVRPTRRRGSGARRVSRGVSTASPLVGAVAAVVTATATSCGPDPAVTRVVGQDSAVYAFIDRGYEDGIWARSTDGGQTWNRTREPNGAGPADASTDPGGRPHLGPPKVCGDDGACYRLRGQRVVERRSPDGGWIEEFRLSDEEFDDVSGMCIGGDAGVLTSVAVAESGGARDPERAADDPVVASLGAGGVLVRTTAGAWERTRVLSVPPVPATALDRGATWASLVIGLVLTVTVWAIGRRRWPSWRTALAVVAMGWAIAITATSALLFALDRSIDPLRVAGWLALGCAALTTLVAVAVARRPRRAPVPHLASWAPHPVPPPPPPSPGSPSDHGWPPPG
jgi:hypothetical protein